MLRQREGGVQRGRRAAADVEALCIDAQEFCCGVGQSHAHNVSCCSPLRPKQRLMALHHTLGFEGNLRGQRVIQFSTHPCAMFNNMQAHRLYSALPPHSQLHSFAGTHST